MDKIPRCLLVMANGLAAPMIQNRDLEQNNSNMFYVKHETSTSKHF